jgi:hypothetical protein
MSYNVLIEITSKLIMKTNPTLNKLKETKREDIINRIYFCQEIILVRKDFITMDIITKRWTFGQNSIVYPWTTHGQPMDNPCTVS